MDKEIQERINKKVDICYLMGKECIPFAKYTALHKLEERHGVDLGQMYKTKDSVKMFSHFIAEAQRHDFLQSLSSSKFYSFLMDGSTDQGNVEEEMIANLHSTKNTMAEEVNTYARLLCVQEPRKADSDGLLECLGRALIPLGVTIGGGTDGASVNVSEQNGMMGKLQRGCPWMFWAWCFAHHLELASKDAFSSTLFQEIDDMLLRLDYLYSKSPKKTRELSDIVDDLKEFFEFPDGGNLPVRCQGSRWISHKRKALQRFIDRYGAYISHLMTLVEDKTIKSVDRAKLKGYLKKWRHQDAHRSSTVCGHFEATFMSKLMSPR